MASVGWDKKFPYMQQQAIMRPPVPVTYREVFGDLDQTNFVICNVCGTLVFRADQAKHAGWHQSWNRA